MFSSNKNRTTVYHSIRNVVQVCELLKYVWSTRTIYSNVSLLLGRSEMIFSSYPQPREGLPCKKDGVFVGNFVKNPQELPPHDPVFWSPDILSGLNTLKVTAKAPAVDLSKLNILRSTKPLF